MAIGEGAPGRCADAASERRRGDQKLRPLNSPRRGWETVHIASRPFVFARTVDQDAPCGQGRAHVFSPYRAPLAGWLAASTSVSRCDLRRDTCRPRGRWRHDFGRQMATAGTVSSAQDRPHGRRTASTVLISKSCFARVLLDYVDDAIEYRFTPQAQVGTGIAYFRALILSCTLALRLGFRGRANIARHRYGAQRKTPRMTEASAARVSSCDERWCVHAGDQPAGAIVA
jgi:hypothetical protein